MKIDKKKENRELRFNQLKKHYELKLHELIEQSLDEINEKSSIDFINELVVKQNKKWLSICAQSRQLDKVIKLNINAFKLRLTESLAGKYPNLI